MRSRCQIGQINGRWRDAVILLHATGFRVLCLFICTNMASAQTDLPSPDRFAAYRSNSNSYTATMKMLEASLRANVERISTWSGMFELKEGSRQNSIEVLPSGQHVGSPTGGLIGNLWLERDVIVRFAVDFRNDRLFTTFEAVGRGTVLDRDKKERIEGVLTPMLFRHVVTGEHWLKATVPPNDKFSRGRGIFTAERLESGEAKRFKDFSIVVDPRSFYCDSGNKTFFDFLRVNLEWIGQGNDVPIEIVETGSGATATYTLKQEFRFGDDRHEAPNLVEIVFDAAVGFNPVSMKRTGPNGNLQMERRWEYALKHDVYIPKNYTLTQYASDSSEMELRREFSLVDSKLNEPIADDMFGWSRLGLMQGDQIRDRILDEVFRYDNEELVAGKDFVEVDSPDLREDTPIGKRSGRLQLVVLINIGLFLLAIVYFAWRRRFVREDNK